MQSSSNTFPVAADQEPIWTTMREPSKSRSVIPFERRPTGSSHGPSDEQKASDFKARLEAALEKIADLIKQNQGNKEALKQLDKALKNRGFWASLGAKFSSTMEKEFSTQMVALCGNLGLTQDVILVMLEVQTEKSRLLQEFHRTLLDKISKIVGDTQTLDDNQYAVLAFLEQLRDQVEEQLRMQALVESHEESLGHHKRALLELDDRLTASNTAQQQAGEQLEAAAAELRLQVNQLQDRLGTMDEEQLRLQTLVESHEEGLGHHKRALLELNDRLTASNTAQQEAREQSTALQQRLAHSDAAAAELRLQVSQLQDRQGSLEVQNQEARSLKAVLLRQIPALVALGVALSCLFHGLGTA